MPAELDTQAPAQAQSQAQSPQLGQALVPSKPSTGNATELENSGNAEKAAPDAISSDPDILNKRLSDLRSAYNKKDGELSELRAYREKWEKVQALPSFQQWVDGMRNGNPDSDNYYGKSSNNPSADDNEDLDEEVSMTKRDLLKLKNETIREAAKVMKDELSRDPDIQQMRDVLLDREISSLEKSGLTDIRDMIPQIKEKWNDLGQPQNIKLKDLYYMVTGPDYQEKVNKYSRSAQVDSQKEAANTLEPGIAPVRTSQPYGKTIRDAAMKALEDLGLKQ